MEKPFKTISEQIFIMRSRGLLVDDSAVAILEREGYYPVVNGYKDPFLDSWKTGMALDDRFKDGATFADLYALFSFDRDLRLLFLKYMTMAEAVLKTTCAYCFTREHPNEVNPYLELSNYAMDQGTQRHVLRLISDVEKALGIGQDSPFCKKDYLKHYMVDHGGEVPLWVLMNYLSFGQAFKFYTFLSKSMQNTIAKSFSALYAETHKDKKRINPEMLRLSYDHIKDFRNMCAHDERFYCSRVAKSKDISVRDLCADLEIVLSAKSHALLMREVLRLTADVERRLSFPIGLAKRMGWKSDDALRREANDSKG